MTIEPLRDAPTFLSFGAWSVPGSDRPHEVVTRRRLDARNVVPFFARDGVRYVGLLRRLRASRLVRGAPASGLEAIGIDFSGVDETGDVLDYERAIFSARTHVAIDPHAAKVPLPSQARSVGYLAELSLPLLVPITAPSQPTLEVSWDGGHHRIEFVPLEEARAALDRSPHAEDLAIVLRAYAGAPARDWHGDREAARAFVDRNASKVWREADLARAVEGGSIDDSIRRVGDLRGDELRFLRAHRVEIDGISWEIVTPHTGVSLTIVPCVVVDGAPWFLLWSETRASVLERRVKQPVFDLPIHPRYVNATGCFLDAADARAIDEGALENVVRRRLAAAMRFDPRTLVLTNVERLGVSEPAPSTSSELRHRVACTLDPRALGELPDDVRLVPASDLRRAIADGRVKDPVVVDAAVALGLDPFAEAFHAEPARRDAFLDTMTGGSIVQRRLQSYSSIEVEQLGAPTYARLMTLLQHEYGVRIAYPHAESDRGFFKAAFRVFMAAERVVEAGESREAIERNRALQGLHWSHDAFHFALGNFTVAPTDSFEEWFEGGAPPPGELAAEGPRFDAYYEALKAAEDEATFFSFWTLYEEQPSLARHVDKLTYHAALRAIGVVDRAEARAIFDDVTHRATLPARVASHDVYRARADVRGVFEYMLGFRDYHKKDIVAAWRVASKDPYRSVFVRFGLYEHDLERYLSSVRGFQARLEAMPPGLNPLACACADVRVAITLRVWDVVKGMKLARVALGRGAIDEKGKRVRRRDVLELAERAFERIARAQGDLATIRARITNAEMVPRNEAVFQDVTTLASAIEAVRADWWGALEATNLLDRATIEGERSRELPR